MKRQAPPLRWLGLAMLAVLIPCALVIAFSPTHLLLAVKPITMRVLMAMHDQGVANWLTWVRLEVIANVVAVVPLALAATLACGGRRCRRVVAVFSITVLCSIVVELVQLAMPGRIASVTDVLANALGALIGVAIAAAADLLALRRRQATSP